MEKGKVEILDTTMRDGNYIVNFQFTARDTAWMCKRLEEAGISYIEVGHGLGLGASKKYGKAAASDEEYISAARGSIKKARFGMFAIPGVAREDDIAMAADLGMDFVRIGSNANEVNKMEPLVKKARKMKLFVCTNFMKSYVLSPEEFAKIGIMAESFGSQLNYIVDSAGGMLPEDIERYFAALKENTKTPIGFHGHDNTRMATMNSLTAAAMGASLIDATLFGVGRGSGNAATELIVSILKKRRPDIIREEIDEYMLIKLAENEAAPLLYNRHQESLSMSLGLAQVHSSFLDKITQRAQSEGVDPHRLIEAVGKISKVDVNEQILHEALAMVGKDGFSYDPDSEGILAMPDASDAETAVKNAENLAEKLGTPCKIWIITDDITVPRVRIKRTPKAIEVIAHGDPRKILKSVERPLSEIYIAEETIERYSVQADSYKGKIHISREVPGWIDV